MNAENNDTEYSELEPKFFTEDENEENIYWECNPESMSSSDIITTAIIEAQGENQITNQTEAHTLTLNRLNILFRTQIYI